MLSIPSQNSLIEQCVQQNQTAQRTLFDLYFPKMMAVCLRYLKNEEDASEVLNNAFLKIFTKISQYKAEGSFEGWIKRIVINSALNFIRSNKAYRNRFIPTSEFQSYGTPNEIASGADDFLNSAYDLSQEQLFDMVTDLPPATRVVFNLYVIEDFSHKQIAKQLNISEGTSKWHLSNARKLLKEKINEVLIKTNRNSNHGK
jgi:RNA polymerase sigma-70 factor (ECF subfamily)